MTDIFPSNPLAADRPGALLFNELVTLVTLLGEFMAYGRGGAGREGDGLVSLPLWRRARHTLRAAEGLFRRLVLLPALALADALAEAGGDADRPVRRKRPAAPPPPAQNAAPEPLPVDAPIAGAQPRAPLPSGALPLLRLHEALPGRPGRPPPRPAPATNDLFGTLRLPLTREYARYCALIVAVEQPGPSIERLAAILLRRRRLEARVPGSGARAVRDQDPGPGLRSGQAAVPFALDWGLSAGHWPAEKPGLCRLVADWSRAVRRRAGALPAGP